MSANESVEIPVESTPAPEAAAPASSSSTGEDDGWNGEVESLSTEEWYASLEPERQERVRGGMQKKWSNLRSGWTRKEQALAAEKAKHLDEIARREKWVIGALHGDENILESRDSEIARLTAELQAKAEEIASLSGRAKEEARAEFAADFTELEELRGYKRTAEQERQAQEALRWKEKEDAFLADLEKTAPEVFGDLELYADYCTLIAAGRTPETALKMVRATLPPKPVEPEPEEVPDTLALMGEGGAGGDGMTGNYGEGDSIQAVMLRERRKIAMERR